MASLRLSVSAFLCALPGAFGANLFVSHYNGNIYSLSYTGPSSLKVTHTLKAGGQMPSWLTYDSAARILYITDESGATGGSTLTAVSAAADGSLKVSATGRSNGGELHSTLYGGSDGKGFLAAAEYDPSSISTWKLPIGSGQSLQKLTFTMSGRGTVPSRQDKPHPHSVFTEPTGKYLLSADLGADLIRIFSIDASSGKLTQCTNVQTAAGDGPRHGAFWSKSGDSQATSLYTVNELGNSVTSWKVSYGSGCLSLQKLQTLPTYPEGKKAPSGSKAAEVHVSGDFVYAVNRNDKTFGAQQDSAVSYSIAADGSIKFMEATNAYTWYPRTFQINKAGDMVAFGGQTSSTVAIVERNVTTGRLGAQLATVAVGTPGRDGQEDGLSAVIWDE
ncbi:putative isomerase YbhE [Thozetella sp. PMI_491]|nr:putative isomerase YbhE [Thozetella sp. PMI_491]